MTGMSNQDNKSTSNTFINRRGFLKSTAAIGLGMAGAGVFGSQTFAAKKSYQWASSSLGSTGYRIIGALAAGATKFSEGRHSSTSTAGASENMILIGSGEMDFGQTTSADYKPAHDGSGQFSGHDITVWQTFAYTSWQLSPMVRADSGIKTIADFAGKRVMPVKANGTTHVMWRDLFTAAGVAEDKIEWSFGSWTETYGAMKKGAVDVIPVLLTNGRPSGRVSDLEASGVKMRILDIPNSAFDAVKSKNPGILRSTVQPSDNTTKFVTEPTSMVTLAGIVGANPKVDADGVYDMMKGIMDNLDWLKSKGSELKDVSPEFGIANLMSGYPVHPGAARYYKEKGIWRDDLTVGG